MIRANYYVTNLLPDRWCVVGLAAVRPRKAAASTVGVARTVSVSARLQDGGAAARTQCWHRPRPHHVATKEGGERPGTLSSPPPAQGLPTTHLPASPPPWHVTSMCVNSPSSSSFPSSSPATLKKSSPTTSMSKLIQTTETPSHLLWLTTLPSGMDSTVLGRWVGQTIWCILEQRLGRKASKVIYPIGRLDR